MATTNKRLVILFSGNGSNMENIIHKLHHKEFVVNGNIMKVDIVACVSNNKEAFGIQRAKNLNIDCLIVPHKDFATREDFETTLIEKITPLKPDLIVLAGFMRILSPLFVSVFKSINIHPSLLPKFKGANAIQESFDSSDREVGVSAHWVNEELDSGAMIMQAKRIRDMDEDFEYFSSKIHELEYELYPQAILKALN